MTSGKSAENFSEHTAVKGIEHVSCSHWQQVLDVPLPDTCIAMQESLKAIYPISDRKHYNFVVFTKYILFLGSS